MSVAEFRSRYAIVLEEERKLLAQSTATADPSVIDQVIREARYKLTSIEDVWAFTGCTESQIEEVRAAWGDWLPPSFEAFLSLMGCTKGYVDLGFGLQYPQILTAANAVQDWLDETAVIGGDWFGDGDRFRIPDHARHLGHRGGGRFYFILDRDADPVVHQMVEGSGPDSGLSSTGTTFSEIAERGLRTPRPWIERSIQSVTRRQST